MKIKNEDIKRISKLAMIDCENDEKTVQDISALLQNFSSIKNVDLSNTSPMVHPPQNKLIKKSDKAGENLDKAEFISQSPKSKYGYILVPKIISEQE